MRWKTAKYKKDQLKVGEIRKKRRFLFWPKTIAGETRWLELATWYERWRMEPGYSQLSTTKEEWFVYSWADNLAENLLDEVDVHDG